MNAVTEVMDELRKALAELEDCRARNADMRTMLEQVTRERDAAIARITEVGVMIATNGNRLAKDAYRRGAEAMREACLRDMERFMDADSVYPFVMAHSIRALPIPEEP